MRCILAERDRRRRIADETDQQCNPDGDNAECHDPPAMGAIFPGENVQLVRLILQDRRDGPHKQFRGCVDGFRNEPSAPKAARVSLSNSDVFVGSNENTDPVCCVASGKFGATERTHVVICLLYTSDAADEMD